MSDDEGSEGFADYGDDIDAIDAEAEGGADDGGAGPPDEGEAGPPRDEEAEGDEEVGLDEDAAGTDEEEEGEEAGPEEEETELGELAGPALKAAPQRAKVDPILRASNRHRVVRVVPPEERVTDNRLQIAEAAYVLAMRAEQIAQHATHFATQGGKGPGLHDPVALAYRELFDRRTPLILRRAVGTGPAGELIVEDWPVREMTLPPLVPPVPLGGSAVPGGTGGAASRWASNPYRSGAPLS